MERLMPLQGESSLRLRREHQHTFCKRHLQRIIPPLTEGTTICAMGTCRWRNHPSAYGGNSLRFIDFLLCLESSLRLRREPYICRDAALRDRIIPPLTEGTPWPCGPSALRKNHPSAYGGNQRLRRGARHAGESSLRLRREPPLRCNIRFLLGIIPPLTEGTRKALLSPPSGWNHPSAYGGNTL